MKEALVSPNLSVKVVDSPKPTPAKGDVLIKVICAGTNPKDWKFTALGSTAINPGEDIAGIIEQVGEGVLEFQPGDRVAALHRIGEPFGAFAEYAIAPATTTFHIPESVSFEEAASIPLTTLTAAIGLYHNLKLPMPWESLKTKQPLIIYGGSTAIGAFAIKFAQRSNVHPLIIVAGKSGDLVEQLLDRSQGDTIIDYREGEDRVVAGIRAALTSAGISSVAHALDAVSEPSTFMTLAKVLEPKGHIAVVVPFNDYSALPQSLTISLVWAPIVHTGQMKLEAAGLQLPKGINHVSDGDGLDLGLIFSRLITRGLQEGWLSGHPTEVVPGGLNGVETGLKNLKADKAHGAKYVYRIIETQGI